MRWPLVRRHGETQGVATAREALARVEADAPMVEAVQEEHKRRLLENDFTRKMSAALHVRRVR